MVGESQCKSQDTQQRGGSLKQRLWHFLCLLGKGVLAPTMFLVHNGLTNFTDLVHAERAGTEHF